MRPTTAISLALSFLSVLALGAAVEPERSVDIFAWPLSSPKSHSFAKVGYNSTTAVLKSYSPPSIPAGDDVVRIGFHHSSGSWSGIATSSSNLAEGKDQVLQLLLNAQGEVYHVGLIADNAPKSSKGGAASAKGGLRVEVVSMKDGPNVHLNKPVVLNEQGQMDGKEPEKSFLQKYWWAIGGFILLQVVLGGGKGE